MSRRHACAEGRRSLRWPAGALPSVYTGSGARKLLLGPAAGQGIDHHNARERRNLLPSQKFRGQGRHITHKTRGAQVPRISVLTFACTLDGSRNQKSAKLAGARVAAGIEEGKGYDINLRHIIPSRDLGDDNGNVPQSPASGPWHQGLATVEEGIREGEVYLEGQGWQGRASRVKSHIWKGVYLLRRRTLHMWLTSPT